MRSKCDWRNAESLYCHIYLRIPSLRLVVVYFEYSDWLQLSDSFSVDGFFLTLSSLLQLQNLAVFIWIYFFGLGTLAHLKWGMEELLHLHVRGWVEVVNIFVVLDRH